MLDNKLVLDNKRLLKDELFERITVKIKAIQKKIIHSRPESHASTDII